MTRADQPIVSLRPAGCFETNSDLRSPDVADEHDPNEPDSAVKATVFMRWPYCRTCQQRMLMVDEQTDTYAFICLFCEYRASIPKT
jgi:hypothetical protein